MNAKPRAPDAGGHANALAREASPYLRQHAHNPVDWLPWGDAAFARARTEDKPIFLSIGYAACHWCHVMAHESFMDPHIALLLNEHFIAINVDREERPDVDDLYMTAVQMLTGTGGWPLSVFLTPAGAPFFGGTYFPPEERQGTPGFARLVREIARLWRERRADLLADADALTRALQPSPAPQPPVTAPLSDAPITAAVQALLASADRQHGGFGRAPKFPNPAPLQLLLCQYERTGDAAALAGVTRTLDAMAAGGIHDQIAGGFHRYATDAAWRVPHFEKMLYDNAQLAALYLTAYQATRNEQYRAVAVAVCEYVLRDLTDSAGGFYSAEDADSGGREGAYYTWTPAAVRACLPAGEAALCCAWFGITDDGNFEGATIPHVAVAPATFAAQHGLTEAALHTRCNQWRTALLAARAARPRPATDDKIIVAWNGLMISALARAWSVTNDARYRTAATRAATFVLTHVQVQGRLHHSICAGRLSGPAFADDYAGLILALLDVHQTTRDGHWLAQAEPLAQTLLREFWDDAHGCFFLSAAAHTHLLARPRPLDDHAVPSANALAAQALFTLGGLTKHATYQHMAARVVRAAHAELRAAPTNHCALLGTLAALLHAPLKLTRSAAAAHHCCTRATCHA
jgi:uncharacterized protein YyaL (SSP411 family)